MILLLFFYFLVKEKVTDPTQCSSHPFFFHVRGDYTMGLILFQWGWKSWTNCNLFLLPFELTGQAGGTLVAVGRGWGGSTQWRDPEKLTDTETGLLRVQPHARETESRQGNTTPQNECYRSLCALIHRLKCIHLWFFFLFKSPRPRVLTIQIVLRKKILLTAHTHTHTHANTKQESQKHPKNATRTQKV